MLPNTWQTSLRRWLEPTRQNSPPRIAVLGIGNPLRSDDAAGVLAVRRLAAATRLLPPPESLLLMDARNAPENRTAELCRFAPNLVLMIDAAETGLAPGSISWIEIDDIDGLSASTHTLPLSMLAKYLILELDCEVRFLGIQPRSNDFGEVVSGEVSNAVNEMVDELAGLLYNLAACELQSSN